MFADAYEKAASYTRPLVSLHRTYDGQVHAGLASYVILNQEGWVVTAAHVLAPMQKAQADAPAIAAYEQAKAQQHPRGRRRKGGAVGPTADPGWVTHAALGWGDGVHVDDLRVNPAADLAIGRLVGFVPTAGMNYPEFRSPGTLRQGESLCRMGFPFQGLSATWSPDGGFAVVGSPVFTRFPNEGIYTREVLAQVPTGPPVRFIETSTPGLRGQSGGPLFDKAGRLCGIQTSTQHLPLGFSPELALPGGKKVTEHQFLNVGWSSDVANVVKLLAEAQAAAAAVAPAASPAVGEASPVSATA